MSADVRTQVCVPVPLAPFVSSSPPEAAHLSVAPFHFIPLQSPPPLARSPPTNAPEDRSGSVVFQTLWHCLFQQHNPAFQPMLLPPQRRTQSHQQKVSKTSPDSLAAAPSAVLGSEAKPATSQTRSAAAPLLIPAESRRGVNTNLDFPIYFTYILFNASLPTLMTSAE